jgi:hypothetical protein
VTIDVDAWPADQKARFLAALAHELTIFARAAYVPQSEELSNPALLRAFNELMHRVTDALRDCLTGRAGIPVSAIIEMTRGLGERRGVMRDMERAISRAHELTATTH